MARSQDGYPGGGYSIGEAPSPSDASVMAGAAKLDRSRVSGNAACCQQGATLDLSTGRSLTTVTVKRRALAEPRRAVGRTQEQLAALLGVERSTVVRWEAGETTPQPWCRPKLAEAIAVSVDELDTMLIEGQAVEDGRSTSSSEPRAGGQLLDSDTADGVPDDPEHDPVLTAPWSHRGTVEAAVMLSGGDSRVKRRAFLTGTALTAPAHQWLVHEPEPLVSGLKGRRVSAGLADRLPAMIAELRAMDDVAGGGSVLSLAQHEFV